jgi:polysaccharide biosynthesis transport protein
MLQTDRVHDAAYGEAGPAVPKPDSVSEMFEFIIGFVRRRLVIILFALVLVTALGEVLVIKILPAKFAATATLIIDTRKYEMFQHTTMVGDTSFDQAAIESQLEILKSENIALTVIRKLQLADESEFGKPKPGMLGSLLLTFTDSHEQPASEFSRERRALAVFGGNLTVRRLGPTYVIEITFRSFDAARAAEIANTVGEAYILEQLEGKYEATKRASDWLQDRLKQLGEQASVAQRAVIEFKSSNNIVDAGNGRLVSEQQLTDLNGQLTVARQRASEASVRLARVQEILGSDAEDAAINAAITDALKNDVVTKLRTQYHELSNREQEWSQRYGRNHLATVNLRTQLNEIRNSIRDELKRVAEAYRSDLQIAKKSEESLEHDIAQAMSQADTTNQARVSLRELESSAQSYRSLYDNFLQRYMESVQQQTFPITDARLITRATAPGQRDFRKPMVAGAAVPVGGLLIGVALAFLRELRDRVFRTAAQVETSLRTNCLALVPLMKSAETKSALPARNAELGSIAQRTIMRGSGPIWTAIDSPFSRFADAMRSIKVAADLNAVIKSNRVIGFTSSLPDEGKSTVAASFAQIIAQSGSRVILVDCDLRNPSLTRLLAPNASVGFLDVISGKSTLGEVIWTDPSTNMAFLPAVLKSRLAHSAEVLGSDGTRNLINALRREYEYVVVDLSPLAPIVDVRATTRLFDSYVFVIEWGRTKIDVVLRAFEGAEGVYDNLLGAVLNKTNLKRLSQYDSRLADYYGNKRYGRYGYLD